VELPTVDVDLGSTEHPLMDEARRVGPNAPQGQKRILAIDHPLVYRLRHGRWRRATWLEDEAARFWLLAGAQRAAGSHSDAYEVFVALHAAGELLPNDDDRLRDVFERDARVLTAARAEAPPALVAAAAAPETDVVIRFGELVDARVLVSAAGDEVWVAIATRAADGALWRMGSGSCCSRSSSRLLAEVSEPRPDWPSGPLEWFEVARLGCASRSVRLDAAEALDVFHRHAGGVRDRRSVAAEQRVAGALNPRGKVVTVTLDVLVDGPFDDLRLLETGHRGRVADLLLRGLVNLDGGLCACYSVPRY
jgi:hypothetical protein